MTKLSATIGGALDEPVLPGPITVGLRNRSHRGAGSYLRVAESLPPDHSILPASGLKVHRRDLPGCLAMIREERAYDREKKAYDNDIAT